MTIQRIRTLLEKRPFRPFGVHTSGGQFVKVSAPDFAWIHPSGRTMYVCPNPAVDADEVIDLLHITKLTQGPQRRNGRKRK